MVDFEVFHFVPLQLMDFLVEAEQVAQNHFEVFVYFNPRSSFNYLFKNNL
jgi:hypothetical protein